MLVPSGFDVVPFGSRFSRPPKTRPGGSRELRGTHFGTILNLCWTLPEPIAASLGPAALPNFGRTWQRRRRNIKRLRVAQGPPRGLQGALGDSCWDNVDPMFERSGAHRGFIWGLPGLRSESSWSSRASQFWHDLAAKTPEHLAPQAKQESAAGVQPLDFFGWKTRLVRWFVFLFRA